MPHVAGPRRFVADLRTRGRLREDRAHDLVDRRLPPIPDIVYPRERRRHRREHQRRHHVAHVDEIARLLAVAVDRDRFARQRLAQKDRDRRVRAPGLLTRTERVENPQRHDPHRAFRREHRAVVFAVELGDGVGRARLGRHRFELREGRVVAVNLRGAAETDPLHARRRRFFQDVEIAGDVGRHAFERTLHGFRAADHRGEVEHPIHPLHRRAHGLAVEDRAFEEIDVEVGQILAAAGAQVVQHADRSSSLEVLDEVAADEPRPTGHEDALHARRSAGYAPSRTNAASDAATTGLSSR